MTTMTLLETDCDRDIPDRDCHWKLFLAVDAALAPRKVLYPACRFDVAPSLVFPDVTYVDDGADVAAFFSDIEGVLDIVAECSTAPQDAVFRFVRSDCSRRAFPKARFDLVISLNTRPVADSCAGYLKIGGAFLTHPASQDATTLATAPNFALSAVVIPTPGEFFLREIDHAAPRRNTNLSDSSADAGGHRPHDPMTDAVSLVFTRIG